MNLYRGFLNIHFVIKCEKFNRKHHLKFLNVILEIWKKLYFSCEIPSGKNIDESVYYNHNGYGIIISPYASIGKNVNIQHRVTIGVKNGQLKAAEIEENVTIGACAVIVGGGKSWT